MCGSSCIAGCRRRSAAIAACCGCSTCQTPTTNAFCRFSAPTIAGCRSICIEGFRTIAILPIRTPLREEQAQRTVLCRRLLLRADDESGALEGGGQHVHGELAAFADTHVCRQLRAQLVIFADDPIDLGEPLRAEENRKLGAFAVDLHEID